MVHLPYYTIVYGGGGGGGGGGLPYYTIVYGGGGGGGGGDTYLNYRKGGHLLKLQEGWFLLPKIVPINGTVRLLMFD